MHEKRVEQKKNTQPSSCSSKESDTLDSKNDPRNNIIINHNRRRRSSMNFRQVRRLHLSLFSFDDTHKYFPT